MHIYSSAKQYFEEIEILLKKMERAQICAIKLQSKQWEGVDLWLKHSKLEVVLQLIGVSAQI